MEFELEKNTKKVG